MDRQNLPFISVIIPTYNRGKPLIVTLNSLLVQNYPRFEIIVVDQSNRKYPEKENFFKTLRPKIKYFKLSIANAAAARNLGVKKAKGNILLFLDDDAIADFNLIKAHQEAYMKQNVGAIAGRVITTGQKIEKSKRNVGRISPFGKFSDGFSSQIRQEVTSVITCNASWKKNVFEKIDGFDENFSGPIREDSDLSLKTIKAGYKITFEPKALVVHSLAKSGGFRKTEGRIKWYRGFFKSEAYFCLKWISWYWWPLFLLMRWQWFLRCMFGREVSFLSISTPWLGIYEGWKAYQKFKNENRS
jgi:GT2 family glycosyltransferase